MGRKHCKKRIQKKGGLEPIKVTQQQLFSQFAPRGQYAGITKRPIIQRLNEHKRGGYSGQMYYAPTKNMKRVERKLLEKCPCYKNRQRHSNAPAEKGYAYVTV